jgi:diguanylate cyclase (GGDEF)-like protein/PAS domain S-box-containing protein
VIEVYSNQEFKLSDNELKMFEKIQNFVETYYAFYQENRNLKLIFNAAGEGIYGLDLNGNATFINPAACQILGYSEQELIGVNMHEKVHYKYPNGKFYKKEDCYMFSAFKEGKSYHITNEVLWRKDKTAVEVEYTSTPIYENKKIVGAVITFIDVSSEAKFRHNINEIANIQEQYIKNENKKSIFNRILAYLLRITESEYGFIGSVLSSDAGLPYLKTHAITNIAWNDEMKLLYEKNNSKGIEFHNLETLFGYTLKNGESVISNDPATDERSGGLPKGHPALTSYLGVPIFGASGLIAMFGLGNKLGGYSKAILNELVPMTNMLSSILDSMHHHDMISDMAKIDSLTGVYNRNFFEQKINATIVSHREKKTLFSLLMLDLNDFKKINDFHGHDTGDKFLYLFCQKMKLILKEADFFSRIGGDEFCVILEDIKESNNAEKVAKRILEACDKKYLIDDKQIFCKPSIGIVTYPIAGESREILMKHVDFALYEAKKKSSGYEVYSALLKEHYLKITKMEEDIREAFEKKEFYCVYQPQMNTLTNKIHGIEVLLRWKHLDKGELSPTLFIPIIEKMKLSKQLNVYVLETCLKEIKSLKPDSPIIISLNLSPSIEELPDHLIELLTIIKKEKLHPNISLEFELTESSFISNSDEFEEKLFFAMGELKKANIRFAIDDFGVEYSSINRLIEYDFDTIKIDMLFVHKLSGDTPSSASAIIKAILGLSRDLGFDVVAEGAEKKEQIHALNILGCHIIQGFHFFKPLSKDSITKLINSSDKK